MDNSYIITIYVYSQKLANSLPVWMHSQALMLVGRKQQVIGQWSMAIYSQNILTSYVEEDDIDGSKQHNAIATMDNWSYSNLTDQLTSCVEEVVALAGHVEMKQCYVTQTTVLVRHHQLTL